MLEQSLTIHVGSTNPAKIQAVQDAFEILFPKQTIVCHGIHAPSLVADQPMTEAETRQGAVNRVHYCQTQDATVIDSDRAHYYVAMEGGVDLFADGAATFAYIAIANHDMSSVGRSCNLPLPETVYQALQAGEELGEVMDRLFHTKNIKQAGGAIGLLTQNKATRAMIYTQAIILAMAPLLNPELYRHNPFNDHS